MTREFLTVLAMTLLMLAEGCDDNACREQVTNWLVNDCPAGSRLERDGDKLICRCPPFAPAASGSVKP